MFNLNTFHLGSQFLALFAAFFSFPVLYIPVDLLLRSDQTALEATQLNKGIHFVPLPINHLFI